jgi:hypothetical protein
MHKLAQMLGPTALATKEFKIVPEGDPEGRFVRIVGRPSGLFAFLLHLIKVDTTTTFEVFRDRVVFTNANLSGALTTTIPLSRVVATQSGYFKPTLYLLFGFLTLPLALTIVGAIVPLFFFVLYAVRKTLLVSALTQGDADAAIAFKKGVLQGVEVSKEDADRVVVLINQLLMATAGTPAPSPLLDGIPPVALPVAVSPTPLEMMSPPKPLACAGCGASLPAANRFCEACGTPVG